MKNRTAGAVRRAMAMAMAMAMARAATRRGRGGEVPVWGLTWCGAQDVRSVGTVVAVWLAVPRLGPQRPPEAERGPAPRRRPDPHGAAVRRHQPGDHAPTTAAP